MSTSLSDNNVDMAIFDSYSKTVMRNMSRKKTAVIKKQKNNETGGAEVMQYVMETYGKEDMYPSEFVVSDEHGHSCVVTTEWLYQAMTKLKEWQNCLVSLKRQSANGKEKLLTLYEIIMKGNIHNGREKT